MRARTSLTISSAYKSVGTTVKPIGSPHNVHSTSRAFAQTTTLGDGTDAWRKSWPCVFEFLPSPGVAASWQSTSDSRDVAPQCRPHPMPQTPPNPRLHRQTEWAYGVVTPVLNSMGCGFWNAVGKCSALRCNGCTRCKHYQGSTEMEWQSCWLHHDHHGHTVKGQYFPLALYWGVITSIRYDTNLISSILDI